MWLNPTSNKEALIGVQKRQPKETGYFLVFSRAKNDFSPSGY